MLKFTAITLENQIMHNSTLSCLSISTVTVHLQPLTKSFHWKKNNL